MHRLLEIVDPVRSRDGTRILSVRTGSGHRAWAGIRGGRVRWLAILDGDIGSALASRLIEHVR